jgi:4-diphosphocytidyl-2-C-methyl-D-erythritol kinase
MLLIARCPAKVNLALRVLGRRPDGYHEVDTVLQAVDLWDVLEVRPSERLTLTAEGVPVPLDERNLVLRAARALSPDRGAAFHLRKAIPVGGGLGGGSSDAAGALLLLRRLWEVDAGLEELRELSREIGADVSFFFTGGTARGTGRGDRIEPLPFVGDLALLLGMPPFGIPTGDVYDRFQKRLTPRRNDVSVTRFSTLKWPGGNDFGLGGNDLEDVVFEGWPQLRAFRDALLGVGARRALVSGSGATVFGIFPARATMRQAVRHLGPGFPGWALRPCRPIRGGVRVSVRANDVR